MKTTCTYIGLSAALLGFLVAEPLLSAPPRPPYGGISHPTYASQRDKQQQANLYRYRSHGPWPSLQSRPIYSYEPSSQVAFKPGDRVVVTGSSVELKRGLDVLGIIPNGAEFMLTNVQGRWLGGITEIDGRKVSGWVAVNEVNPADAHLRPQGKAADPAKDRNTSTNAGQQASSGSQYEGRCNVRTHRSTGRFSHSSRIPENLSTFRWGWWDLKDRW